jgi:hypothetical protein
MSNRENMYHNSKREDFREKLDFLLHPSRHIEIPNQLYGRSRSLNDMRDSFETANVHPKAYPVDAGVATSCGALPPGGTPVFRCWDM